MNKGKSMCMNPSTKSLSCSLSLKPCRALSHLALLFMDLCWHSLSKSTILTVHDCISFAYWFRARQINWRQILHDYDPTSPSIGLIFIHHSAAAFPLTRHHSWIAGHLICVIKRRQKVVMRFGSTLLGWRSHPNWLARLQNELVEYNGGQASIHRHLWDFFATSGPLPVQTPALLQPLRIVIGGHSVLANAPAPTGEPSSTIKPFSVMS